MTAEKIESERAKLERTSEASIGIGGGGGVVVIVAAEKAATTAAEASVRVGAAEACTSRSLTCCPSVRPRSPPRRRRRRFDSHSPSIAHDDDSAYEIHIHDLPPELLLLLAPKPPKPPPVL